MNKQIRTLAYLTNQWKQVKIKFGTTYIIQGWDTAEIWVICWYTPILENNVMSCYGSYAFYIAQTGFL